MATFTIPNVFVANTVIKSADVNANFAAIAAILNSSILPPIGGTPGDIVAVDDSGNFTSIPAPAVKGDLLSFSTIPDVLSVGTDGQVLTADSTSGTGLSYKTPTATSDAGELNNLGLGISASAGTLTIALKQSDGSTDPTSPNPVIIAVRSPSLTTGSYNLRQVTSALSMTIPVGVPLNTQVGTTSNLWIYALDTDGAGTMALGASTVKQSTSSLVSTFVAQQTVTISIASPAVITTGMPHNYIQNSPVVFSSTGALPTGITAGTTYYVYNPTSTTFNIALLPSIATNTPINTSGSQSGIQTMSMAGGAIVASANYTNIAAKLIGKAKFTLSSQGTWVAPSAVALSSGELQSQEFIGFEAISASTSNTGITFNVLLDTPIFDTHNMGPLANSDGLIIVPKTGKYLVSGSFFQISIPTDASVIISDASGGQFGILDVKSADTSLSSFVGSKVLTFNANDGFFFQVSSAGPSSVVFTATPFNNTLAVTYLGDMA